MPVAKENTTRKRTSSPRAKAPSRSAARTSTQTTAMRTGAAGDTNPSVVPKTAAWDTLNRALGASLDESIWDHFAGTTSEPFPAGIHRRIAINVIDERGNELMVVKPLG